MKPIGIVDYGAGNLGSVSSAFGRIGANAGIVREPNEILGCGGLVIPGVGSFRAAMQNLAGVAPAIDDFASSGKPVLGICLGMQVLFKQGSEGGACNGLGLLEGKVRRLEYAPKLPHVGWNQVEFAKKSPLADGLKQEEYFYFAHSYECIPSMEDDILASTEFGGRLVSAVRMGNVFGVQFHPEKSGAAGERLLKNFWKLV